MAEQDANADLGHPTSDRLRQYKSWLDSNPDLAGTPNYQQVQDVYDAGSQYRAAQAQADVGRPDTSGINPVFTDDPSTAGGVEYTPIEDNRTPYEQTSLPDKITEVLRSGGRGIKDDFEFFGDLTDIPVSLFDQYFGSDEGDMEFLNTVNPFGKPDAGDIAREGWYDQDWVKNLTEERIKDAPGWFDRIKTGSEYGGAMFGGGAVSIGSKARKGGQAVWDALRKETPDLLRRSRNVGLGAATGEATGRGVGHVIGDESTAETFGNVGEFIGSLGFGAGMDKGAEMWKRRKDPEAHNFDITAEHIMNMQGNDEAREGLVQSVQESLDKGESGTLAGLSGNQQIYNLESTLPQGHPLRQSIAKADEARKSEQTTELQPAFGESDPVSIFPQATGRRNQQLDEIEGRRVGEEGRLNQAVDAQTQSGNQRIAEAEAPIAPLQGQVDTRISGAGNTQPISQASLDLDNAYNKLEADLKAEGAPFWQAFDEQGAVVDTTDVASTLDASLDALEDGSLRKILATYGDEIEDIRNLEGNVTPKKIHDIVENLKSKLHGVDTPKGTDKFVGDVTRHLDDVLLKNDPSNFYAIARSKTKEAYERSRPSVVGQARDATVVGNQGREQLGELLTTNMNFKGPEGRVLADRFKRGNQEIQENVENAFRSMADKTTIDKKFVDEHREFLSQYPALEAEFDLIVHAQKQLDEAVAAKQKVIADVKAEKGGLEQANRESRQGRIKRNQDEINELNNSIVGIFARDPVKAREMIDTAIKSSDPEKLNRIVEALATSPESSASLKALIGQQFGRMATDANANLVLNPKKIEDWKRVRDQLRKSGLMDDDEIKVIDNLLEQVSWEDAARKSANPQGVIDNSVLADIQSSLVGGMIMKLSPVNNLIMGSAARRTAKALLTHNNDPRVTSTIETMIKNPELMLPHLEKYKHIKDPMTKMELVFESALSSPLATTLIVTGGNEEDGNPIMGDESTEQINQAVEEFRSGN